MPIIGNWCQILEVKKAIYKRPLPLRGLIISKGHIRHISDDVPKIKFILRKF